MAETNFKIEGMTCGHCVQSVTEGLSGLEGIRRVEVNLEKGQASVEYDEGLLDTDAIKAKIQEIGYRTA